MFLFKLERFIDITLNTQHKKKIKRKKVRADDDDEVKRFIYLGEITLVNSLIVDVFLKVLMGKKKIQRLSEIPCIKIYR